MLSAACLIGTVLLMSRLVASPALAVYALSFWHYLFYWWAYRHGAVQPARFRRDAMLMKSVALTALASAWLPQPWHWPSALAIGSGFLLNLAGARALGHTRTYYGWELGISPQGRVTSFPYSLVPHPMLVGNIVAFGGTLLNPDFRHAWWPLAILHVVLNVALIVMETSTQASTRGGLRSISSMRSTVVGAALLATSVAAVVWPDGWAAVAVVAGASAAYGYTQYGWYVPAVSANASLHDARSQEAV